MRIKILVIFSLIFNVIVCKAKEKLNVLFIIADDLNCDLGAYGHHLVKTPNINRLASEGMLFQTAYCNVPWSGPSRASMMTGLYPDQTGHYELRDLVRDHVPEVVTLPQNFMNNGYVSARVGKIYHYDNPNGIGIPGHDDPDSWNERYFPKGIDKEMEERIFSLRPGFFGATLSWLAAEGEDEEHTDGMVATKAIELLEKYADTNTPFFLGVGFYKPHTPFVAPKKYFDLYPKDQIRVPGIPENYLSTLPEPARKNLTRIKEQNNLDDSLAVCAIQAYYACISFLDAQVGRVVDALERLGLKDNTIIVFTSDNGYHMGEHGYYQKYTLFENAAHIPLIISAPGMKGNGKISTSFAELIDLYPTLSDIAGLTAPVYVAGKSLKPVLNNPEARVREAVFSQIKEDTYTLLTKKYRYIRWGDGGEGMIELYDRKKDPEEMNNLARQSGYKKIIRKMDSTLDKKMKSNSVVPKGLKVIR